MFIAHGIIYMYQFDATNPMQYDRDIIRGIGLINE